MKGIMFNLLEDVLGEAYGPDAWDDLLTETGASGVYAALGDYPDSDFFKLIDTAGSFTNRNRDQMLITFGEAAFSRMVERYPAILEGISDSRTFLLSLNRIVQAEVRKLYAGAGCPHFRFAIAPDMLSKPGRRLPDTRAASKHIAHHDWQPNIAAIDNKLGVFELGRTHTDFWIL